MLSELNTITVKEVLMTLGNAVIEVIGPPDRLINKPVPIHESENGHNITFCNLDGAQAAELIKKTKAGVILCSRYLELGGIEINDKTLIIVDEPRLSFLRLVNALFALSKPTGIHPTAVISPDAEIASNVYIGPFTYIGRCRIGEDTIIYGSVYIYDNTKIGREVIIHAGTIIGSDGFGYHRNEMGELEKFPHIGSVIIKDNVEIGSNTCIDRGALSKTTISKGVKINNCVHIAHNVTIDHDAVINAHVSISGSVTIGASAWLGPCACVRDGLTIGKRTKVGMGAVVVKNIEPEKVVVGNPAKVLRTTL